VLSANKQGISRKDSSQNKLKAIGAPGMHLETSNRQPAQGKMR